MAIVSPKPPNRPVSPQKSLSLRECVALVMACLGMVAMIALLMGWRLVHRSPSEPLVVPPPRVPLPETAQTLTVPNRPQSPLVFVDVPPEHWARAMIDAFSARRWLNGFPDGTLQPEKPLTRAEFSTQIALIFDRQLEPKMTTEAVVFQDVPAEHWAAENIRKTVHIGFLQGFPGATFAPEQPISRVEVLVAIANGLNLVSSSAPSTVLARFEDSDALPAWAVRPMVAATESGLVVNYPNPNRLEPSRPASRAEVVAILYQTLVYLGQFDDLPLPYAIDPQP